MVEKKNGVDGQYENNVNFTSFWCLFIHVDPISVDFRLLRYREAVIA